MTTTLIPGNSNGARVRSNHASSYATMYSGSNLEVLTSTPQGYGVGVVGGVRYGSNVFDEYTWSVPTDEYVVAASIRLVHDHSQTTGTARALQIRQYDFGATVTTADWRTNTQFAALTLLAEVDNIQNAPAAASPLKRTICSRDELITRLLSAGPVRTVGSTDMFAAGSAPSPDCQTFMAGLAASGTADDPTLVTSTISRNSLVFVAGAQCKLSDNTWVCLEADAPAVGVDPTITLVHHDGTTRTVVATIPISGSGTEFAAPVAQQSFAMCVDDIDNIYVMGQLGNAENTLAARAYIKGTGHTWTTGTQRSFPAGTYDGQINNIAAAWHDVGTSGTIVCVFSHTAATGTGSVDEFGQVHYGLLNCDRLLTGTGTLLRTSGNAAGKLVSIAAPTTSYNTPINETGTLLDIAAVNSTRGYVVCATRESVLGEGAALGQCRYVLASDGTSLTSFAFHSGSSGDTFSYKDAAGKARVLAIDASSYVAIGAHSTAGVGIHPVVNQNTGTSSTFTNLGEAQLPGASLANMPNEATIAASPAWDAVYDPTTSKVWIYYVSSSDANKVVRTDMDLSTMLLSGTEYTVSAAVGAAGSTVRAIRVSRGASATDKTLVTCAVRSSGGAHSTVYVLDTFNLAPNAPVLTPHSNYDATSASNFVWTFSDPNPGDTQSAYQLIIQTSTGTGVVDTGKVTSTTSSRNVAGGTLTNGNNYQWRVRTWDQADVVGAYSAFSTFSTSAGGAVTITDPASDNPAGVITDDYTIAWSVSGTTQAGYRVKLIRTDTSAVLSDTGWVTSTATTYHVTGMITDVEHRIEVTVRNASLVESGTGTRLITPSFGSPEKPTITVTAQSALGYVEVSVTNPTPTGDRPEVSRNDVYRRPYGLDVAYGLIGSTGHNGTFKDYTAGGTITYEYKVRGEA